jgi:hypothetical protein
MDASGVVLVAPLHHFCSDYFVVVLFSSFFSKELVDPAWSDCCLANEKK